jgi:alginate O-acetyltransferase complex protein AlgI
MLFNSISFIYFFLITVVLYFILPHKNRWLLLLLASAYFYMAYKPIFILILVYTIIVDYFAAIAIEDSILITKKKIFLILSLFANIGVLFFFKYFNFFSDNINLLLDNFHLNKRIPILDIILPIGLSFHTFQAISYTIEVYRGKQKAERHIGYYSLYVLFFPQLVAGPIERPQNVLHQFHEKKYFNYENSVKGFQLIIFGLFKKIVIADRLSIYVNEIYKNPDQHYSLSILIAALFFSIQIYCDFSGYSDIAKGSAKILGYDLMLNFNYPYFSKNISEFWSRWHISLSTWFRDYVYIPLGGNRVSNIKYYRNILIVFGLSGFWHGANWTFIIWGIAHAFLLVFESIFNKNRIVNFLLFNQFSTFLIISLTWIFFRSENILQSMQIFNRLFSFSFQYNLNEISAGKGPLNLIFSTTFIIILLFIEKFKIHEKNNKYIISIFILLILLFGNYGNNEFIYFQF